MRKVILLSIVDHISMNGLLDREPMINARLLYIIKLLFTYCFSSHRKLIRIYHICVGYAALKWEKKRGKYIFFGYVALQQIYFNIHRSLIDSQRLNSLINLLASTQPTGATPIAYPGREVGTNQICSRLMT